METVTIIFPPWAPKSLWMVIAAMKLKDACSLEEKFFLDSFFFFSIYFY